MKQSLYVSTRQSRPLVALLAAIALLLAACGSTPAAGDPDTGAASTAAAANASTTAAASTAAGAPVTVTWWGWNGGPAVPGSAEGEPGQLVVEFNKTHPDVQVEWKFYQYNDYLNALKLAIASGEGPDLFGLQAGALVNEYNEFTEDLAPRAAADLGAAWEEQYYPLGFGGVKIGDKLPAMPVFNSAAGYVWYNKTIFDEHGLTPPTTLDEWVSVCKTLSAAGTTCFVQGAKDAWVNFDMFIALANDIAPGKIYEAEAGTVPWTDPDLVKAMELWQQLFSNGIMQNGALGASQYPDMADTFHKGEAAMILFGMWEDSAMTNAGLTTMNAQLGVSETYEFLPFPFPDVNGDGQTGRLFGGPDVVLAMNAASEKKDAAWEFIKWVASKDGGQQILANNVAVPAMKGLTLNDSDVTTDAQKANLKQQLTDLENAVGKREFAYPEIKTALGDALQNVATSTQSPEQALQAVEQVSQTIER